MKKESGYMLDFPNDKEVLSYCAGIKWLFDKDLIETAKVEYTLNPDNTVDLHVIHCKIGFLYTFGINLLLGKNNPLLGKVDVILSFDEKTGKIDTRFIIRNLANFQEYTALMGLIAMNKNWFAANHLY